VSRLSRFEAYRFVGVRDSMRVYDCDDETQFAELAARVDQEDLVRRNQIQVFAPDDTVEARNRGFRALGPKP
jgi:hypothetical protein